MAAPELKRLNDISVKTAASLLGLCPNKLFRFLREQNIFSNTNIPYGRYTARGYFRLKLVGIRDASGCRFMRTHGQPRVTETGLIFIQELLDENPETADKIRKGH